MTKKKAAKKKATKKKAAKKKATKKKAAKKKATKKKAAKKKAAKKKAAKKATTKKAAKRKAVKKAKGVMPSSPPAKKVRTVRKVRSKPAAPVPAKVAKAREFAQKHMTLTADPGALGAADRELILETLQPGSPSRQAPGVKGTKLLWSSSSYSGDDQVFTYHVFSPGMNCPRWNPSAGVPKLGDPVALAERVCKRFGKRGKDWVYASVEFNPNPLCHYKISVRPPSEYLGRDVLLDLDGKEVPYGQLRFPWQLAGKAQRQLDELTSDVNDWIQDRYNGHR